eukprot:COSAG01_NODE_1706_length_9427_cov_51.196934_10_plen_34_part_00
MATFWANLAKSGNPNRGDNSGALAASAIGHSTR